MDFRALYSIPLLLPDTLTTRSLNRYRKCSISHRIGDGIDFTDRIVNRTNCYILVIRVRDHISRIHVVEHNLTGSEQNSDGSDGIVPIFVRIDPLERAVGKQTLDEHGIMHSLSLTTTNRRMMHVCTLAKGAKG